LTLSAEGLRDFFDNTPASDYQTVSFAWSSTGTLVVDDLADPRLEDACVRNGKLQLTFSETPNMDWAPDALLLDGATTTWTLQPDGYTLEQSGTLSTGSHELALTQDPFDLAEKVLADLEDEEHRTQTFEMPAGGGHVHVYSLPLPGEQSSSTIGSVVGNVYGFQGLPYDKETGFLYVRHRYYDPEMGRFVQTDAHGYADAPNLYQYALGDPINNSDPTGLEAEWSIAPETGRLRAAGIDPDEYRRKSAEAFLEALGNPYVQGTLQIVGGCSEAVVGFSAVWSGVGTVPGAIALAHGSDLCGTGIGTWIVGETQDPLLIRGARKGFVSLGMDPYYANLAAAGLDMGVGVGALTRISRAARIAENAAVVRARVLENLAANRSARPGAGFRRYDVGSRQIAQEVANDYNVGIDLEHIFHGEIRRYPSGHRRAVGFHHNASIGSQMRGRIVGDILAGPDAQGLYKARVEIFDVVQGDWVLKGGYSTFYPSAWSRSDVLKQIRSAYVNRIAIPDGWEGISASGVRIRGFMMDGRIRTAFPVMQ